MITFKPIKMAKSTKNFAIFDLTKCATFYKMFPHLHEKLFFAMLRDVNMNTKTVDVDAKLIRSLVKELDTDEKQIQNALSKLVKNGMYIRVDRGVYKLNVDAIRKGKEETEEILEEPAVKLVVEDDLEGFRIND